MAHMAPQHWAGPPPLVRRRRAEEINAARLSSVFFAFAVSVQIWTGHHNFCRPGGRADSCSFLKTHLFSVNHFDEKNVNVIVFLFSGYRSKMLDL